MSAVEDMKKRSHFGLEVWPHTHTNTRPSNSQNCLGKTWNFM